MKKILAFLIFVAIMLTVITTVNNGQSIIIYSSMEQFRNEDMQDKLNEEFPDLDIFVMYIPTAKAAAKIAIEGEKTDADIVVDLEGAYMNKVEKFMAEVEQYSRLEYLPDAQSDSERYVVWSRQAGSVVINKDILDKYDLPIPETYEDLLNPVYKNMIAMPDPKTSGTGFFFLRNLVNVMGEDEAFDYMDKLAINVKQFTESGSGPIKLLMQGEIAVGLGLTFQAVNELNNGNHFIIMEPEFGSPYSFTCTSMIKGRENDKDILRVFDYIVNEYMLIDKMYGSPEKVLTEQENRIENYPQNIHYADMTEIDDIQEKERLLERWKY